MAQFSTSNYIKGYKFELDGKTWEYRAPGAGVTLELSKASRKSSELEEKVKKGTASKADQEEQTRLVELAFNFYNSILKDGTEDNSEVKAWLNDTPMDVIASIVQDIQKASEQ